MNFKTTSLLVLLTAMLVNVSAALRPVHLTCEGKEDPLGIESMHPRFGWWISASQSGTSQGACQIQVTDLKEKFGTDATIWDSKKMKSPSSSSVSYQGPLLLSGQKYFWRVRVWNQSGEMSEWSDVAVFKTGLLSQSDWARASWIGFDALPDALKLIPGVHGQGNGLDNKMLKRSVNPYFRKTFSFSKTLSDATVFVSGLGHYEFYINGNKIGNEFLAPGWTNYEKNCLYNTYDVTKELHQGGNVLSTVLGSGFFYINRERYRKFVGAYGYPMMRLVLRLRYTDGTSDEIVSDGSWKTAASPVVFSSIYGGEDYDARLEQEGWNNKGFDDSNWKKAVIVKGPSGRMSAQVEYPLKVMDTIAVKAITHSTAGRYIYDFGQNASGIIELTVQGKAGDTIRVIPSELLDKNGLVTQKSSGGPYYLEYVLKGKGVEKWAPRFTYYGFRYAMVEGAVPLNVTPDNRPKLLSMHFLHTRNSAPSAGSFECSNPLFNKIHHLIDWAMRSNMASVSTDCPHREKMGWLEQAHLMGESLKYNYDIFHLYNKVVNDIIEAQQPDGLVPSIAPEYVHFDGPYRDDPGYGSAAVILPWSLYKWYGDREVLVRSYDMMKRYVDYLSAKSQGNIISFGLGDWLDIGPREPGISQLTPIPLSATAFYYQDVVILSKTARVLGFSADLKKYEALSKNIKEAFNRKFYNSSAKVYGSGSQTSFTMPLYMGLLEEEQDREAVLKNLVDSVSIHQNRITAGDIGHRFLVKTLQDGGYSDLLFEMNNRTDIPGYGYQIKHGATALAEHWSGPTIDWLSQNHMIFGHLMEWFYSALGGIKQAENDSGYKQILIEPQVVGDITWVKSSYKSVNGVIRSDWSNSENKFRLDVSIPVNSTAEIILPSRNAGKVLVDGKALRRVKGIKDIRQDKGSVRMRIPSGHYTFECASPEQVGRKNNSDEH